MRAIPYRILFAGEPVGKGVTNPNRALVRVVAKAANVKMPYLLANEIVAMRFAQHLNLPVPPGCIAIDRGKRKFVSLDFSPSTDHVSPADVAITVTRQGRLCWGVILFDAFLVNKDRRPANLAYDAANEALYVFDHGNCLFGAKGPQKLTNHEDVLGIGNHCLARNVTDVAGFETWNQRIQSIPDWFIEEAVTEGLGLGYTEDHVRCITDFLKRRKTRLGEFTSRQGDKFPKISEEAKRRLVC